MPLNLQRKNALQTKRSMPSIYTFALKSSSDIDVQGLSNGIDIAQHEISAYTTVVTKRPPLINDLQTHYRLFW